MHGEEEAKKALEAARALFVSNSDSANMPSTEIESTVFENDEVGILDLLVLSGLCASKGEGRRLVQQGGISVDDQKINDPTRCV